MYVYLCMHMGFTDTAGKGLINDIHEKGIKCIYIYIYIYQKRTYIEVQASTLLC